MRSFLLVLLFAPLAALAQTGSTAEAPFGPRLGPTIDRAERDYFLLFPEVDEFESATLVLEDDGAVRVTIQRGSQPDEVLTVDSGALLEITDILRRYETAGYQRVRPREALRLLHEDLPVVFGASNADPRRVAESEAQEVEVVLLSGERVAGTLLYASDDAVAVWTGGMPYHWTRADAISALSLTEVESVRWQNAQTGVFPNSAFASAVSGGGTLVLSGAAPRGEGEALFGVADMGLAALQAAAAFRPSSTRDSWTVGGAIPLQRGTQNALERVSIYRRLPPEVASHLAEATVSAPPARARSIRFRPSVHVSLSSSARLGLPQTLNAEYATDFAFAVPFGFTYEPGRGSARPVSRFLHADVALGLVNRLRVGVEWAQAGAPDEGLWTLSVRERTASLYAEADVIAPDATLRPPFALFVGGGVGQSSREATMPLNFAAPVAERFMGVVPREYRSEVSGLALLGRVGVDLFADRGTSVRILGTYRRLPAMSLVPEAITAPYGQHDVPAIRWDPTDLPTSALEVSVATRLRF